MFHKQEGRQQGIEYYKTKIFEFRIFNLGFDCYILDYPDKIQKLPWHTDKIPNASHLRLNIQLFGDSTFFIKKGIGVKRNRNGINLFRADKHEHSLVITRKTRKLSLGFAKYKK